MQQMTVHSVDDRTVDVVAVLTAGIVARTARCVEKTALSTASYAEIETGSGAASGVDATAAVGIGMKMPTSLQEQKVEACEDPRGESSNPISHSISANQGHSDNARIARC